MKIGKVKLDNNILLAPLAGVTDIAFRTICKMYGAGLTYTEMVSGKGLYYDSKKTFELLLTHDSENVKAVQLFGSCPDVMSKVVEYDELDKFDIIDINMGCPVKKIVNNGEGSALMKDLKTASSVISEMAKKTKKPITVKFRKGFDDNNINAVEFAKMCSDSGASAICVHGRTRSQMYSGKADYDIIKQVKKSVSIPVIGNGDIFSKVDASRMFNETGCDGIMIARGAFGNPQIFCDILGHDYPMTLKETIKKHIDLSLEYMGERYTVCNMKKHIAWYVKGNRNSKTIKTKINEAKTTIEMICAVNEYLD